MKDSDEKSGNVLNEEFLKGIGLDAENIGLILSEAEKIRTEFSSVKSSYEKMLASVRREKIHSALKDSGAKSIAAAEALIDTDKLKFDGISVNGLEDEIARIRSENNFLFSGESVPHIVDVTQGTENSSAVIRKVMGL